MKKTRQTQRARRRLHIRKTVCGTSSKPRLSVFRSNRFLFVQAVDDEANKSMAALSESKIKPAEGEKPVDRAERMGKMFGALLKKVKITTVVFDRGGYKYHGRIKRFADGVREEGIKF